MQLAFSLETVNSDHKSWYVDGSSFDRSNILPGVPQFLILRNEFDYRKTNKISRNLFINPSFSFKICKAKISYQLPKKENKQTKKKNNCLMKVTYFESTMKEKKSKVSQSNLYMDIYWFQLTKICS